MKNFFEQIPIMTIKGFIIFLGFGLILIIINKLLLVPIEPIYYLINQVGMVGKIIGLTIIGMVAQYTFWKQ